MSATEALKSLHAKLIDARNGYETAEKEADSPKMKLFFSDMLSLHEQFHTDIHGILKSWNVNPDDEGTLLTLVHKAVISFRSAVTGLDENSVSGFADGEERIIKAYDETIEEMADNSAAVSILTRHRERLRSVIAEMKRMST